MSLWFQKAAGIESEILREAASNAAVSWEYETIKYKKQGIGYPSGKSSDAQIIKDEIEKLLGFRPIQIDEPLLNTQTDRS
jgi:hypothetical protein